MKMIIHLILCISFMLNPLPSQVQEKVRLLRSDQPDRVVYSIQNDHIYPITVTLKADYQNLNPSERLPLTKVIQASSSSELITFESKKNRRPASVNVKYGYFMGDINARHNSGYQYRLPYQLGTSARVSQSYYGTFSHKDKLAYAVDFELPEGTSVFAARGGVVIELEEGFNEGGEDPAYLEKANYVTVMHRDGSFADYTHLKMDGVLVNIGQQVRTGQLIGYSGATGYVSGPHLHFHVKMVNKEGDFNTIPVRFKTNKSHDPLQKGETYKAL